MPRESSPYRPSGGLGSRSTARPACSARHVPRRGRFANWPSICCKSPGTRTDFDPCPQGNSELGPRARPSARADPIQRVRGTRVHESPREWGSGWGGMCTKVRESPREFTQRSRFRLPAPPLFTPLNHGAMTRSTWGNRSDGPGLLGELGQWGQRLDHFCSGATPPRPQLLVFRSSRPRASILFATPLVKNRLGLLQACRSPMSHARRSRSRPFCAAFSCCACSF